MRECSRAESEGARVASSSRGLANCEHSSTEREGAQSFKHLLFVSKAREYLTGIVISKTPTRLRFPLFKIIKQTLINNLLGRFAAKDTVTTSNVEGMRVVWQRRRDFLVKPFNTLVLLLWLSKQAHNRGLCACWTYLHYALARRKSAHVGAVGL